MMQPCPTRPGSTQWQHPAAAPSGVGGTDGGQDPGVTEPHEGTGKLAALEAGQRHPPAPKSFVQVRLIHRDAATSLLPVRLAYLFGVKSSPGEMLARKTGKDKPPKPPELVFGVRVRVWAPQWCFSPNVKKGHRCRGFIPIPAASLQFHFKAEFFLGAEELFAK